MTSAIPTSRPCLGLLLTLLCTSTILAAPTPAQRKMVSQIKAAVRKAEVLSEQGKSRDSLALVKKIHTEMQKLVGDKPDADLLALLAPAIQNLKSVHGLLELNGLKVPSLPELKPKAPEKPAEPAGTGEISFSKQIAPLLVTKCGRCHVDDTKGKVSMTSFAKLMEGHAEDGPIIIPKESKGSRIYEVIESGDMPRGGSKLTGDQLAMLLKWIDQGAKSDAPSENTPLRQLARATNPRTKIEIIRATGRESVLFSVDLAPVLEEQCMGCHGGRRPRGRFNVTTFNGFLRGGESGPGIVPGKPGESILIQRLKGIDSERMPQKKPALPTDVIAKFEKWIAEGAKFDGQSPDDTLQRVIAVANAIRSTPEELSQQRVAFSEKNWRLAIPDDAAHQTETEHFLVLGNVSEAVLTEVGEAAELQVAKVSTALKIPTGSPMIKGRLTIYAFANRYDFSEFGTMVENRTIPKSARGHWKYDIVDPYVTVLPPRDGEYSINTLLAQQLASVYVTSKTGAKAPRWLSEGAGRAIAARMDSKDPRVLAWEEKIPEILSRISKPNDFLTGKLSTDDSNILSYGFVKFLMSDSTRFSALIKALGQGAEVENALARSYGGDSTKLADLWVRRGGKKGR